jgi:hypothetical protein
MLNFPDAGDREREHIRGGWAIWKYELAAHTIKVLLLVFSRTTLIRGIRSQGVT